MAQWEDVETGWEDIKDESLLKKALGVGEGVLSTATGIVAGIPTGLRTLGELAAGNDLPTALERAESTQKAATYEPSTKTGKDVAEGIGKVMSDYAATVGEKFSGDVGGMNKRKLEKGTLKASDLRGENTERLVGDILGGLYVPGMPMATRKAKAVEEAKSNAAEVIKAEKEALKPKEWEDITNETSQLPLFDQSELGQQRSPYGGGKGTWAVDENGMPVRTDISMEAANVEAPLQKNLWGDELGPALGQERSLTDSIDLMKREAEGATDLPTADALRTQQQDALGLFKEEIPMGNDLAAAKIQADGQLLPFDEQTAFQPTNPLPTKTLREMESMTGSNAEVIPLAERTPPADTMTTPRSPEMIAAKNEQRKVAEAFPFKDKALDEFTEIRTAEEAKALLSEAKDILRDVGQKQLGSGVNFHAAMSNHPALKYARTVLRDARVAAEQFSREYITAKDTGLSPVWTKLSKDERVSTIDALFQGDRQQFKLTDSVMDRLGFNENQRQFVKTFYEANDKMFNKWNDALKRVGLKPVESRTGHFPGIFTGSYKTLVMDATGKKILGVIATDTKWQQKAAQAYMAKEYPGAKFVEQKRSSLAGTSNRYYSDIFSGMNDVLAVLGKEDPKFLEVQQLVSRAITEGNNKLFNFNVHELAKKGVVGNEGNRPWLKPERNAEDAFKALVRYFEEGALHHEVQIPLKNLKELNNSPEMANHPNAAKYLDAYTKKITGDDLNPLGAAINTIIDMPFKLIGVGPSIPIQMAGSIKNTMSQMFMGFGNYMFTMSQLIQPGQTGLPFMQLASGRLGLSPAQTAKSMGKGGIDFLMAVTQEMTGKDLKLESHMNEAYKYAKERGLLEFSEMERAYQGTKSKVMRAKDAAAEINMKIGEQLTRAPMFMAFTDLLVKGGIDAKKALPIAENLTQLSMIDYHAWERPMVYSKLGVVGGFAGGLTTFKHGFVGQQLKLGKELGRDANVVKNAAPIGLSTAAMLALAGVTGMPFYSELDKAYQTLTNTFGGELKTIRESFLDKMPEWVNSGMVSNASNLNIQGKFSSADMIPDSLAKAASPHLEAFGGIIGNAIDMAKSGADEQSIRNLLLSVTPSGWKGQTEDKVARDPENYLIGKEGMRTIQRTDDEWDARKWTGLRPQREAVEREGTWAASQKQRADEKRQKEISQEYKRSIINGTIATKALKLEKEYQERGGDIKTLIDMEPKVNMEKQFDEKERLQGIPSTAQGIRRFNYYNK